MKYGTEFDDPERYPEDEEDGMAPGDEPHTSTGYDLDGGVVGTATEYRRARRRQRINDMLATREYRERRKEELRDRRGGRFA